MNQVKTNSSVFVIFLCAVVIGNCDNDNTNTDKDDQDTLPQLNPYHGPCIMFGHNSEDVNSWYGYYVYTYNKNSKMVLREYYDEDKLVYENLENTTEWEYQDNLLVKKSYYVAIDDGEASMIDYYTYDSSDNLILHERFERGLSPKYLVESYEYDAQNRMTKHVFYKEDEILRWHEYVYDGPLIAYYTDYYIDYSNDANALLGRETYFYDDKNQLIRTESDIRIDGTVRRIYYYEYNDQGLLIRKEYDSDHDRNPGIKQMYTYEWDEKGNLLSEKHISLGVDEPRWFNTFTYDCWDDNTAQD